MKKKTERSERKLTTCWFNQSVSWFDYPFLLRFLDHTKGNPILDATTRAVELTLDQYFNIIDTVITRNVIQPVQEIMSQINPTIEKIMKIMNKTITN